MQPIHYDLAVSFLSLLAGFYVLAFKLHGFNPRTYTPFLPSMVVASGIMYWGMLLLVSFASVYHHPEWLYKVEWQGTWGYTAARLLNAICWSITLFCVVRYAPKCRNDRKFRL